MSNPRRSAVIRVRAVFQTLRDAAAVLRRDQVSVYAAQASFFVLLSGIPFLLLLFTAGRALIHLSETEMIEMIEHFIPKDFQGAFASLASQLLGGGSLPLYSVTAIATLWSASRGMAAIDRGLCGIYGAGADGGRVPDFLRSMLYTIALIVLVFATLFFLVFGLEIADFLMSALPALEQPITALLGARALVIFPVLTVYFYLLHYVIVRRAFGRASRPAVLPGATLTAVGWMLYSYFYSLYIRFFPRASYLYSGLAVVVIFMLWVYACMTILFWGAELNKLLHSIQ